MRAAVVKTLFRSWRDERGETLIEFGLAAMLFFTIIFGIIEFGLAIWKYNIVSDLAQEGARWASVRGGSAAAVQAATASDVSAFVQSRAVGLNVTVTVPTGDPRDLLPSEIVEVQVQTTFTPLTPLLPGGSVTLSSKAQMTMSR